MVYNGLRSRAVAAIHSGSSFGVYYAVNKHTRSTFSQRWHNRAVCPCTKHDSGPEDPIKVTFAQPVLLQEKVSLQTLRISM